MGPRSISSHASRLCVGVLIGWQVYLKVALPLFVVGELHVAAAAGKLGISGHAWTATEGNWMPPRSSVGWPVHWRGRHLPVRCLLYAGPRATKSGHCLAKRIPARKTRFCELRMCQCRAVRADECCASVGRAFMCCKNVSMRGRGSGAGTDCLLRAWVSWTAPWARGVKDLTLLREVRSLMHQPPDRKCSRPYTNEARGLRNRGRGCPG